MRNWFHSLLSQIQLVYRYAEPSPPPPNNARIGTSDARFVAKPLDDGDGSVGGTHEWERDTAEFSAEVRSIAEEEGGEGKDAMRSFLPGTTDILKGALDAVGLCRLNQVDP